MSEKGLPPKDRGGMDLWNAGILPQHYTASQPRRPWCKTTLPWKPHNLWCKNFCWLV